MNSAVEDAVTLRDPLLATQVFSYRGTFYPLGFAVQIETNSQEILLAAHESWCDYASAEDENQPREPIRFRLGVTPSGGIQCPPATTARAFGHLLSLVADGENFAVCDLQQGFAFGWVSESCLRHRSYLRYHFLEAAVMCLLTGSRVTPIHAACVSHLGTGLLLCGESGAGKSTLAYACARAGFAYTTDDASYLIWHGEAACIRGNTHQVRFRPSARELFPELRGLSLTPRAEGKPSIEVRTSSLSGIRKAPETAVHAILMLHRHDKQVTELQPLSIQDAMHHLNASLFPLEGVRERQAEALAKLREVAVYEFRYRDLDAAVTCLKQLADEMTKR